MNLKNKFNAKRIVSGLLASIMLSQVFIYVVIVMTDITLEQVYLKK